MSRYDIYLYVAPMKIVTFLGLAILFTNVNVVEFFDKAFEGWSAHKVEIQDVSLKCNFDLIENKWVFLFADGYNF